MEEKKQCKNCIGSAYVWETVDGIQVYRLICWKREGERRKIPVEETHVCKNWESDK